MRTSSLSQNFSLTYNNTKFEYLTSCKYLGTTLILNLDSNLTFIILKSKLLKSVGILRKVSASYLSLNQLLTSLSCFHSPSSLIYPVSIGQHFTLYLLN